MTRPQLKILQVNTFDHWGGAEAIALNLFRAYRQRGLNSYLAVRDKFSDDPDVLVISHDGGRGPWYRFYRGLERRLSWLGGYEGGPHRLRNLAGRLAEPGRVLDGLRGIECFRFPGTFRLLDLPPLRPDIVHGHNLHGWYFDLRALPWLSQKTPLVLTLHDTWLLTGHCSQSFDCDRWKTGCGYCPDLTIYPSIRRDATASNWERKQAVYAHSRLNVATPSVWLMDRVEKSMLAPAIVDARVIPNGVDLSVFRPANKYAVREELEIPQNACVLLFTASGIIQNEFKDYRTLRAASAMVAEQLVSSDVLLVALGQSSGPEQTGRAKVRFVPFEPNPTIVAKYYQAADLYLHAARADTFPTTVLEALACGTPVVATAVGGIPEQVKSLNLPTATTQFPRHDAAEATGVLVAQGDADGMARSVVMLHDHAELYRRVADNAANDARQRFDLNRQCDAYLEWYDTILERWGTNEYKSNHPMVGVA